MGRRAVLVVGCFAVGAMVACAMGSPADEDSGAPAMEDVGGATEDLPVAPPPPDAAFAEVGSVDTGTRDVGRDTPLADVGADAGRVDLGVDAPRTDAGFDLGAPDAGRADAGFDLGTPDVARADVGFDLGPADAGFDLGPPDTGPPDTGPPDTGPPDTGPPDTGPSRPYTVTTPSPQAWVDACAASGRRTYLHSADDLWVNTETMGFAFTYWGISRPAGAPLTIDSNGWMALATYSPVGGLDNASAVIPTSREPNAVIAAHWADLNLFETLETNQFVCVATVGSAPSRRYVVEWQNVRYFTVTNSRLYFEVVLAETSHTIDLLYNRLDNVRTATVGLENPAGTEAVAACAAGPSCVLSAGQSFRFVPGG